MGSLENNVVEPEFEGLTEKEANEFKNLLSRFMKSYTAKDKMLSDRDWLAIQFRQELTQLSAEEAEKMADETVESIHEYDKNLSSLNQACAKGTSSEQWFANAVSEAATGVSVIEYGNYLQTIDTAIGNANTQMLRTVTTNAGNVSQCYNLDGFIAEQYHVNQFNLQASMNKSEFVAEVCVPEAGQVYGRNSFDSVIKDGATGKIVHQYQFKYGANAKATIKLLQSGTYNNQRFVVPAEQVDEVRKAFPGKSVEEHIGGTENVPFHTDGLTKQQAKELQLDTQTANHPPLSNWNSYTTKDLLLSLGKKAGMVGVQAAAITTGFTLAMKAMLGDKIDADETIELALTTGADAGIKAAVAGAIKVGVEKGILSLIPKGTPIGIITNIACVGIENIKILAKVATGELTMSQAIDRMGRNTVAMVYGLGWGAAGMGIGAVALSWIPIAGPIIGGLAGGIIGYVAGSKFGSTIYSGLKAVGTAVKTTAKAMWNGVKSFGNKVGRKIFG